MKRGHCARLVHLMNSNYQHKMANLKIIQLNCHLWVHYFHCAVPENFHTCTTPTGDIGSSWGVEGGGCIKTKKIKECIKLNWNFQRSLKGGGGGGRERGVGKSPLLGRYGNFWELQFFLFYTFKPLVEAPVSKFCIHLIGSYKIKYM